MDIENHNKATPGINFSMGYDWGNGRHNLHGGNRSRIPYWRVVSIGVVRESSGPVTTLVKEDVVAEIFDDSFKVQVENALECMKVLAGAGFSTDPLQLMKQLPPAILTE